MKLNFCPAQGVFFKNFLFKNFNMLCFHVENNLKKYTYYIHMYICIHTSVCVKLI